MNFDIMLLVLINQYLTIGFELVINFLIIQKHSTLMALTLKHCCPKGDALGAAPFRKFKHGKFFRIYPTRPRFWGIFGNLNFFCKFSFKAISFLTSNKVFYNNNICLKLLDEVQKLRMKSFGLPLILKLIRNNYQNLL